MSRKKSRQHTTASKWAASAKAPSVQPITVSGRWIAFALAGTVLAAAFCGWLALCLLFWQGSWQLLYHPTSTVIRAPASAGVPFTPIGFGSAGSGTPQLTGWWIPAVPSARYSRYTILYLHGPDGNLTDTVDHLAQLHAIGINIFAFDYRGYGQSSFEHPSEAHWLEDANTALQYLTATRHIDPGAIILDGSNLGADLALEVAAAHPDLAGVVIESPMEDAANAIFNDARANLVPAHLLTGDRWNIADAASSLRIPSLWFLALPAQNQKGAAQNPGVFEKVSARKTSVWLPADKNAAQTYSDQLSRWLDDLQIK